MAFRMQISPPTYSHNAHPVGHPSALDGTAALVFSHVNDARRIDIRADNVVVHSHALVTADGATKSWQIVRKERLAYNTQEFIQEFIKNITSVLETHGYELVWTDNWVGGSHGDDSGKAVSPSDGIESNLPFFGGMEEFSSRLGHGLGEDTEQPVMLEGGQGGEMEEDVEMANVMEGTEMGEDAVSEGQGKSGARSNTKGKASQRKSRERADRRKTNKSMKDPEDPNRKKSHMNVHKVKRHFRLGVEEAARQLGTCSTVLKRILRRHNLSRWPSRRILFLEKEMNIMSEMMADDSHPSREKDEMQAEINRMQAERDSYFDINCTCCSEEELQGSQ